MELSPSPSRGRKTPDLVRHYPADSNNKRQSPMNNSSTSSTCSRTGSPDRDGRGQRLAVAPGGPYFFRYLFWDLFESGQYSDFTIRVKTSASPREFRVHRAVVCPQSSIFEAACRGEFMEASTNTITLNDDDPEIVERMIRYLYTHRYDDEEDWDCCQCDPEAAAAATAGGDVGQEPKKEKEKGQDPFSITTPSKKKHIAFYAIADKYLILPLKDLACIRFTKWAAHHWPSPRFVSAVREIFDGETGNYSGLHEAVISILAQHADRLLFDNDNSDGNQHNNTYNDGVTQLMREYGDISVEVLRRVLERNRIAQRGLEVDVAELQSRVQALRSENRKIDHLQSQNRVLTKELLEMKTALIARRRVGNAAPISREDRNNRLNGTQHRHDR